jgi:peptide/nickel transport system substrate-binding protein
VRLSPRQGVLLVCCIAITSSGCGEGTGVTTAGSNPESSTLTVLVNADEHMLGPNWDIEAKFLVFEPLVEVDAEGNLQPRLLRAWEQREEGAWVLHLDSRARWHDGVPVTAHDIAFSVDLLGRPDVAYISPSIETEVLDDSTLIWISDRKDPFDDYQTYYPKHLLADLDPTEFYDWDFWLQPIGNGPYRYVRTLEGRAIELEADGAYYRGRPAIERLNLKFGSNSIAELFAGNVDAAEIEPVDALGLTDDGRFRVVAQEYPGYLVRIYWNVGHPIAGDRAVRRAATLALDRAELAGSQLIPFEWTLADVPLGNSLADEAPEPMPFDPDEARRVLDEAGWRDTDGDGVREKLGRELALELITEFPSAAVYVQSRLRDVGMRVEVESRPGTGMVWPDVKPGRFETALTWFAASLEGLLGEESILGYDEPAVADLLEQRWNTPDPFRADSLRDLPITYLYPAGSVWAVTKRLRGLESPHRGHPLRFMGDLHLETAD